jgi:hypothetical protein
MTLPYGNTTAEYLVIDKDGNRSTAGPVVISVADATCETGFFSAGSECSGVFNEPLFASALYSIVG